ncbi:protein krasavietz-like [Drosophila busckii]|uniref:protein krasavietz-like n=1 Tax=Drosophila busckii TaxID=30019 RepID=UPI00083F0730|nr:protein krasavietz-like [Drosophila busckii]
MASKCLLPGGGGGGGVGNAGSRVKRSKARDALSYCSELIEAMDRSKGRLEPSWKALDSIVGKPEYARYGEQLYDVIVTGGLLKVAVTGNSKDNSNSNSNKSSTSGKSSSPGGSTNYCVFRAQEELNTLRVYEQLMLRLRRRHKHVDAAFEPHMQRLLTLIANFEISERRRLALLLSLFFIDNQLNPRCLLALGQQPLNIEEGLALEFMLLVCGTLKRERGADFMLQVLKRSGLNAKIKTFMPPMLRSDLYFQQVYQESDLQELIKLHETHAGQELRHALQERLLDDFTEHLPQVAVVRNVRKFQRKHHMSNPEIIDIVWHTITSWNRPRGGTSSSSSAGNSQQSTSHPYVEHTMRQLQTYGPLLNALCSTDSAQIALLNILQEWCYEHQSLFKFFERLVVHLYKAGVLSDEAIMRWHGVEHSSKGKLAFLSQMQRFIHWLNSGSDSHCRLDYSSYLANQKTQKARSSTQTQLYSDVMPVRPGCAKFAKHMAN